VVPSFLDQFIPCGDSLPYPSLYQKSISQCVVANLNYLASSVSKATFLGLFYSSSRSFPSRHLKPDTLSRIQFLFTFFDFSLFGKGAQLTTDTCEI